MLTHNEIYVHSQATNAFGVVGSFWTSQVVEIAHDRIIGIGQHPVGIAMFKQFAPGLSVHHNYVEVKCTRSGVRVHGQRLLPHDVGSGLSGRARQYVYRARGRLRRSGGQDPDPPVDVKHKGLVRTLSLDAGQAQVVLTPREVTQAGSKTAAEYTLRIGKPGYRTVQQSLDLSRPSAVKIRLEPSRP